MSESMVRPLLRHPALLLADGRRRSDTTLVIADVHLGYGATRERPEGPPGATVDDLAQQVLSAVRSAGAGTLVIAGDVKHPIVGIPPGLRPGVRRFFATLVAADLSVEIVPGNHDVGLRRNLPPSVRLHSPEGILHRGVGVFHGHRWPSEEVRAAARIVAGHLHPGVRLAPTPDDPHGKRRCWVRVAPDRSRTTPSRGPSASEVIVLPAFNPIAGIEALNREKPRRSRSFLVGRFLSGGPARGFLLDGTDIGILAGITSSREALGEDERAPPDR
jgi:metallophosphoesterase superfamily enzyme